jgi:hypothetical protein
MILVGILCVKIMMIMLFKFALFWEDFVNFAGGEVIFKGITMIILLWTWITSSFGGLLAT